MASKQFVVVFRNTLGLIILLLSNSYMEESLIKKKTTIKTAEKIIIKCHHKGKLEPTQPHQERANVSPLNSVSNF